MRRGGMPVPMLIALLLATEPPTAQELSAQIDRES